MRRAQTSNVPLRLSVSLPPDLTARVLRQHQESGSLGRPADTVRELILAALDYPEVQSSLIRSAKRAAYLSVRRDFQDLANAEISQLDREWARKMHETATETATDSGVVDGS